MRRLIHILLPFFIKSSRESVIQIIFFWIFFAYLFEYALKFNIKSLEFLFTKDSIFKFLLFIVCLHYANLIFIDGFLFFNHNWINSLSHTGLMSGITADKSWCLECWLFQHTVLWSTKLRLYLVICQFLLNSLNHL